MNYETVCNLHAYFRLLRKYKHTHSTHTHIQHSHTYSTYLRTHTTHTPTAHTHTHNHEQMPCSALVIYLCISIINLAGNWPSADRQAGGGDTGGKKGVPRLELEKQNLKSVHDLLCPCAALITKDLTVARL